MAPSDPTSTVSDDVTGPSAPREEQALPRQPEGHSPVVAIFGGRSEIGLAVAERLAPGSTVVLAARPGGMEEAIAQVQAAGPERVIAIEFDADSLESQQEALDLIDREAGPIDVAILAFGILGDQARAEVDAAHAAQILHTDFTAQATLLLELSNRMKRREPRTGYMRSNSRGTIVAFSSVAGIRVRRPNFVYGSAKAGLDGFAQGLAHALHGTGVHLVIARPGFVKGRMTRGMKPAPFSSTPDQVADAVVESVWSGRGTEVWIPWQLKAMFSIAPFVPSSMWRRMPR